MVLSSLDLTVPSDAAGRIFVGKQQGRTLPVTVLGAWEPFPAHRDVHGMFPPWQSLLLADEDPQPHPMHPNTAPATALLALAGEN